jgi:glycosyltransferase involved in cell wall biosynthesis
MIIFSANYLPNLGGVERYTYNLSKKMIERGYQVTVVTSNTDKLPEYEEIEGIGIYRLPCYNLLRGRFPVSKFNKRYRESLKKLKKVKYDICITNTRFYLHSLIGVTYGKKNSRLNICIEHGTNHFTVNNKFFDFLGHYYEHFITLLVKQQCSLFYGVSLACNEWLKHFRISAKGTLYNAIDIDHINNILRTDISNDVRQQLKVPQGALLITYTGRLVKEKGILKLIEAVRHITQTNQDVYLAIAGDGDLAEEVERSTSDNIIYLGRQDFRKIISLLNTTDVFCLPTDYPEGFPTSVLEAAACKCYIISTTSGGSKELVISKEYGCILKENSVPELIRVIETLHKERDYLNSATSLSYNRCIENFTWSIVADKVAEISERIEKR